MSTERRRVFMLGVDAAELSFIRAALPSLPTFRRLFDEGVLLPLRSTAEYVSASVWPDDVHGHDAGRARHQPAHPVGSRGMRMRRIASDWLYCEPFWYDLARAGLGVTVARRAVHVREPRAAGDWRSSNWGSHDLMGPFQASPPALRREIRRRFGAIPWATRSPLARTRGSSRPCATSALPVPATKAELARWLRDSTRWDFFLAVFGECHRAGHILWRDHDVVHGHVPPGALLDVYRAVDAAWAPCSTASISRRPRRWSSSALHGMGSNFSQDHFVRRAMDRINATSPRGAPAMRRTTAGLMRALREVVPAPVQHAIARSVPVQVRDWVVAREVTGGLDWRRTPGFALRSDLFGFVRLNLAGRERDGLLAAGERRARAATSTARDAELHGRCGRSTGDTPILRDVDAPRASLLHGARAGLPARLHPALERRSIRPRACARPSSGSIQAAARDGPDGRASSRRLCTRPGRSAAQRLVRHRSPTTQTSRSSSAPPRRASRRERVLRLGIAGFGRLARKSYVPALRGVPGARVSCGCRSARRLAYRRLAVVGRARLRCTAADARGVRHSTACSSRRLRRRTWAAWRAATGRGIAVFIEKPLVLAP